MYLLFPVDLLLTPLSLYSLVAASLFPFKTAELTKNSQVKISFAVKNIQSRHSG